MLSAFLFGSFLKDSRNLSRYRRGRLENRVFRGDSRCFVCRLCVLLVLCFDFGSAFVVFSPGKLCSYRPLCLQHFAVHFRERTLVFGWCVGFGFDWRCICPRFWICLWYGLPKKLSDNSLIVRSLPFCLSPLALLLFLFFFPEGRPGRGCPPCAVLPFLCEAPQTRVWPLEG